MTINLEVFIGLALFVASELIGMSRLKDNSVLQLLLHMGRDLFPYEVRKREQPKRSNRPQLFDRGRSK